jgi:two-component system chemotaxis response regulator CheB
MNSRTIVIIGASTGGPRTLRRVLESFPSLDDVCIIVVQHMPKHINESVRKSLARITRMKVKLAEDGDLLENDVILLAPGNVHIEISDNQRVRLVDGGKVNFVRPSIDVAMKSLQADPSINAIGVILTGMGSDGVEGISHIKRLGGATIAQDRLSSVIFGMPRLAAETGDVDFVLPPEMIGEKIAELIQSWNV